MSRSRPRVWEALALVRHVLIPVLAIGSALSRPASAQSSDIALLRIACGEDAAGAGVSINGEFKGGCPLDVPVTPGTISVRVTKPQGDGAERVFETGFRIDAGVAKRIDVELPMQPAGLACFATAFFDDGWADSLVSRNKQVMYVTRVWKNASVDQTQAVQAQTFVQFTAEMHRSKPAYFLDLTDAKIQQQSSDPAASGLDRTYAQGQKGALYIKTNVATQFCDKSREHVLEIWRTASRNNGKPAITLVDWIPPGAQRVAAD